MSLASETETPGMTSVRPLASTDISQLSPLQAILQVLKFSKWTGFLPLEITREAGKSHRVFFAGFLPLLICTVTVTLQIVFGLEFAKCLYIDRIQMTDILVSSGHYMSSFILGIIIPRVMIMSKSSLEAALNAMSQAYTVLGQDKRGNCNWPLWLPLPIICAFMVLINFLRVFYLHGKDYAIMISPTVTLGTGNKIVGSILYGFDSFYDHLAKWTLHLQFFVVCRTVINCLTRFRQQIGEEFQTSPEKLELSLKFLSFSGRTENLHDITVHLSKAINAVDSYFSFSLLLFVTCRLISLLGNLHLYTAKNSLAAGASVSQAIDLAISLQYVVTHIAELLFIIWLADSVSRAAEKLKQEVLNVKPPVPFDKPDGAQFQWFQNRVASLNGDITAFGLFTINRRIVLPILGAVVTYFMIIVQFAKDESTKFVN